MLRRSGSGEVLVSRTGDKRLLPRSLSLSLCKFQIQLRVGISVNCAIDSCPISLALVAIVEPIPVSRFTNKEANTCILVSAILVRRSSRLDDVRRRRFADTQVEKRGDDGGVQDIPRVDECPRC